MPQIAQMDYKKIQIDDFGNLTETEKSEIQRCVDNGIIFDCVIVSDTINCRVLAVDTESKTISLCNDSVFQLEYGTSDSGTE